MIRCASGVTKMSSTVYRARVAHAAVALACVLATACVSAPPLVSESDHFRLFVDAENGPLCSGRLGALEHVYSTLSEYLDAPLRPGEKIDYYLADSGFRQAVCGAAARCAEASAVYTYLRVDNHEIVHALLLAKYGRSNRVMEEGIAESIGCDPSDNVAGLPDRSLLAWMAGDAFDTGGVIPHRYAMSGSFVRYLIGEYGIESVLSLYSELRLYDEREAVEAGFARVLGVPATEVVEDWVARGSSTGTWCHPLLACSYPTVPTSASARVELSCAPSVDPVLTRDGAYRSVWHSSSELLELTLSSASGVEWLELHGCSGQAVGEIGTVSQGIRDQLTADGFVTDSDRTLLAEIPSGQYVVTVISLPGDGDGSLDLGVVEASEPTSCPDEREVLVGELGELTVSLATPTPRCFSFRNESVVTRQLTVLVGRDEALAPAMAVEVCLPRQPCLPLESAGRVQLEPDEVVGIRMQLSAGVRRSQTSFLFAELSRE